jgi:hypothetical protein
MFGTQSALIAATVFFAVIEPHVSAPPPLPASIVAPCQQALEIARLQGEAHWLQQCTRAKGTNAGSNGLRECQAWLAACRKNPRHPLPPGVNSL